MNLDKRIQSPVVTNPAILSGAPIVKGTRIPVSLVFDLFEKGYSIDLIQTEYPSLTKPKLKSLLSMQLANRNDQKKKSFQI